MMSAKALQSSLKNQLEAGFKASSSSDAQQKMCMYLKYMRDVAYTRLLQDAQTMEDRTVLVGELRTLQKLLDVLELRKGTVELYSLPPKTILGTGE